MSTFGSAEAANLATKLLSVRTQLPKVIALIIAWIKGDSIWLCSQQNIWKIISVQFVLFNLLKLWPSLPFCFLVPLTCMFQALLLVFCTFSTTPQFHIRRKIFPWLLPELPIRYTPLYLSLLPSPPIQVSWPCSSPPWAATYNTLLQSFLLAIW